MTLVLDLLIYYFKFIYLLVNIISAGPLGICVKSPVLSVMYFFRWLISLIRGDYCVVLSLLAADAIPFTSGRMLKEQFADAGVSGKFHGIIIAAAGWFCVAIFGSLPPLFIA